MKYKFIISVVILFFLGTTCEFVEKQVSKYTGRDQEKIARLKKEGKKSDAEILKVEDMNITVNKNPMVRLYLEVTPTGEPSFDAQVETLVSRVNVPRKGDYVTVYYNPKDKTDIIVE